MILLDTCTLIWLASDQSYLSQQAAELIRKHNGLLFVSAISAFELGIKEKKQRLTLPVPAARYYPAALAAHGVREVAVDGDIAVRSTALPDHHADPADRIIIATAQARNLTILTPDRLIRVYPDTSTAW